MWLALTAGNCRFALRSASEAIGAVKRKRRQENDWNGNGTDVLNARGCGKT
jgi:hypothetical protein